MRGQQTMYIKGDEKMSHLEIETEKNIFVNEKRHQMVPEET